MPPETFWRARYKTRCGAQPVKTALLRVGDPSPPQTKKGVRPVNPSRRQSRIPAQNSFSIASFMHISHNLCIPLTSTSTPSTSPSSRRRHSHKSIARPPRPFLIMLDALSVGFLVLIIISNVPIVVTAVCDTARWWVFLFWVRGWAEAHYESMWDWHDYVADVFDARCLGYRWKCNEIGDCIRLKIFNIISQFIHEATRFSLFLSWLILGVPRFEWHSHRPIYSCFVIKFSWNPGGHLKLGAARYHIR